MNIREKYGGKLHQAINRAIRAEMVGGDDLLDALERVDRLTRRLKDFGHPGVTEATAALEQLRALKELMSALVRARYDREPLDG